MIFKNSVNSIRFLDINTFNHSSYLKNLFVGLRLTWAHAYT
jgi:hypothetical protein